MGLALENERMNAVRFAIVRDLFATREPELSALFNELSEEEHAHMELLALVASVEFPLGISTLSLGDVAETPEPNEVDYERLCAGDLTCADALRMAAAAEAAAQVFYADAIATAESLVLRQLYSTLAALEGEHAHIMESWLARYDISRQ
jgi:rubrerythrin